jgi:glycerophosphoryl diester phosphodiesterase
LRGYILYCVLVILVIGCTLPFSNNVSDYNQKLINIAHRGASGYAPENTFAAFDKAIEMNVDYIELDTQMTKDHELVVIHDSRVDRTTDGTGYVKDFTLKEIKSLDAGSWFDEEFEDQRIPTLIEVIENYGTKVGLLIEIKNPLLYPGIEKKFSDMMKSYLIPENNLDIKVQSFNLKTIEKIKKYLPTIQAGHIVNRLLSYRDLLTITKSSDFINLYKYYISGHIVLQAHQLGLKIYAWTVNDLKNLQYLLDLGIDGAIVDYPEIIHSLYPTT